MLKTIRRLFLDRHAKYEKRFARKFNKALRNQYLFASISLNPELIPTDELERAYTQMYQYIMQQEGVITWNTYVPENPIKRKDLTDVIAEIFAPENQDDMSVFWETLMRTYLNTYIVTRLLDVTKTTARQITQLIEEQRQLGKTVDEIRKALEKEARKQKIRANTIARTETTNAMNKSQVLALHSSGKEWEKSWDAVRDERTRDAHFIMEPTVWIDLNDNFNVGGELLGYPGDITLGASAGNVINCRCSLNFKEKGKRYGFRQIR